jgi:carbon monoxide dehydrogenase subunit G
VRLDAILIHEFSVDGDLETVWRTLLDPRRVAGCLPGATLRATAAAGRYEGSMPVVIGPMTVSYEGSASLVDANDELRRAVVSLCAHEAEGEGTAVATITSHVEAAGAGVRVRTETDLRLTGPQARFGRGVMQDAGGRVIGEFAQRLQAELAQSAADGDGDDEAAEMRLPAGDEALDTGAAIARTSTARGARWIAPVLLAALALLVLWRRRR